VQVTGSDSAAIQIGSLKGDNVTIDNNPGHGIYTPSTESVVKARGLTVTNNAFSADCDLYGCAGIDAGEVKGLSLLVSDNGGIGIRARRATLRKSTVIDNVRAGSTKDLVIAERPRLQSVACNVSLGWGAQSTTHWGVCALDDVP
jgi:hypothetical protein